MGDNMKKLGFTAITAIVMIFNSVCYPVFSAGSSRTDVNSDGYTNVFDIIMLKKQLVNDSTTNCDLNGDSVTNSDDISLIADFVLGKDVTISDSLPENQYPIDESAILEPKGTIHTGEGTFYGGGYEGGCAMLEPISKDDYWIVAMNLEDYNNAQLHYNQLP